MWWPVDNANIIPCRWPGGYCDDTLRSPCHPQVCLDASVCFPGMRDEEESDVLLCAIKRACSVLDVLDVPSLWSSSTPIVYGL